MVEREVVPLVGFADAHRDPPVDPEPTDQGDQQIGPVVIARPAERGADVVQLGVEAGGRLRAVAASERRGGGLDEGAEVLRVAGAETSGVVELGQPLPRVLAQRVEESVAGTGGGVVGDDHRLRHQAGEMAEHVVRFDACSAGDRVGRVEGESAGEHRQAAEHQPLHRVQQVIRPVDRGAQRLMTLQHGASAAGEEPEPFVEAGEHLRRRHHLEARGRELDGQRDAVEPSAQLGDHGSGVAREDELALGGAAPFDEQPDRVVLEQRVDAVIVCCGRGRERSHRVGDLAVDLERLAARGQDLDPGARLDEDVDHHRGRVDDLLTVVEDH